MAPDAHARFDATHRAYEYHIDFVKIRSVPADQLFLPFRQPAGSRQNAGVAAQLLLDYTEFFLCKTHTDVKTMRCDLRRAEWEGSPKKVNGVSHRFRPLFTGNGPPLS